jgi:putative DNA primase/helicase
MIRAKHLHKTPVIEFEENSPLNDLFAPAETAQPTPVATASSADASIALSRIPAILKSLPNWVSWKLVNGSKPLFIIGTDRHASSADPATWVDFETAAKETAVNETGGLGFVIGGQAIERNLVGFDLDGCRNSESGELRQWARSIIDALNSYTEITPSGLGIRVWVVGELPNGFQHVFKLNPESGFGDKVQIEIYNNGRFFTVTGNSLTAVSGEIESRDLTAAYELIRDAQKQHPAPSKSAALGSDEIGDGVQIKSTGLVATNKYELLMHGTILAPETKPCMIEDGFGNSLEYPSQSEADLALCTASALKHHGEADVEDAVWMDYESSALFRQRWGERESYFRERTIAKAIQTAEKLAAKQAKQTKAQPPLASEYVNKPADEPEEISATSEADIPAFDPRVINGIYAKFVELVCRGNTLPPQYAYTIAKAMVGLRMAGHVTFENLDVEPRLYVALIGLTGTGKGESWRRIEKILQPEGATNNCKIKIHNSADSGAGLKDAFFEVPETWPILCYSDEVTTLGNKSKDTRNPAILDTMIELADSTSVSRVLAKSKGGTKTHRSARLAMVMCGQDGPTYTQAFAGRTKLGLWDRLTPEFAAPPEAKDIPGIDPLDAMKLLGEFNALDYSGTMTMDADAKAHLDDFWKFQPDAIRRKARWRKNLILDAYMSAFGCGRKGVELKDVVIAIKIFKRQLIIRQVCFTTEVPDRIGYYIGQLKRITQGMQNRLNEGDNADIVARSERDFETATHAYRDNELHIFKRAWDAYYRKWLQPVTVKRANGRDYLKYLPKPIEE